MVGCFKKKRSYHTTLSGAGLAYDSYSFILRAFLVTCYQNLVTEFDCLIGHLCIAEMNLISLGGLEGLCMSA